jgi:hypothetical protein
MIPPILRARRSRSLSGISCQPSVLVTAAGVLVSAGVVGVVVVPVPVPPEVGPGEEPGPALVSLV